MKISFALLSLWLTSITAETSICRVPDVYEFCSALQTSSSHATSHGLRRQIQQGRPGKKGNIGSPGPRGEKGERGEQGSCQHLETQIRELEAKMQSRFELLPKLVYCAMGMKNGEIPDSAITASSQIDHRFASNLGRLDGRVVLSPTATSITSAGAWCVNPSENQWIQVDFGYPKSVSGVVTQGRPHNHWGNQNWVKTYKISCGNSVENMQVITVNKNEKIFSGNTDKDTKVINKFPEPLTCRFVRLHVLTWNTVSPWAGPCLRMEILRGECHELL